MNTEVKLELELMRSSIARIEKLLDPPKRTILPDSVVPYVECNWPTVKMSSHSDTTFYDNAVRGLNLWVGVVEKAIVVTRPKDDPISFYKRLLGDLKPGIEIVPGFKANAVVDSLDDGFGFNALIAQIHALVNAFAPREIIIDMEETIATWVKFGTAPLQKRVLQAFAQMLPSNTLVTFYPGAHWPGQSPDAQARLREVVMTLDDTAPVGSCRFISQMYQSPSSDTDQRFKDARNWENSHYAKDPAEMCYFFSDFWRPSQVVECLEKVADYEGQECEVFLYPGYRDWVAASAIMAPLVKAAAGGGA